MIHHPLFADLGLAERSVVRGVITSANGEDRFLVGVRLGDEERLLSAERLATSSPPVELGPGDRVLCWIEDDDQDEAVILGRIGPPVAQPPAEVVSPEADASFGEVPDSVVLEAKESLTLRVGEGSITIRADGKILIKGKDLVSHAQRVNRIKGGSVAIN